ncbi:MAG: gliding motility-associated C-terminal domain-containing protein [Bacteroidota bacterium]
MKIFLLISIFTVSINSFSQTVTMGDVGYPPSNPINCNTFGISGTNFFDPGGQGGNYPPNFNDTTVFCPDLNLGTKVTLTFAINAGFAFNVDGSDFIYVYDGPNTSAPLLGIHNSVTDPNGFAYQASWDNPSGCLTVVFVSNGTNEGAGWLANVQCGNQYQPFEPHIEAYINGQGPNVINPIDTGFVDVCFGDSILFVAKPVFPYSEEVTGYGYSQNVNTNIDFDWYVTDGQTYPQNDSIWFTPPARSGYLIDVKATDQFPLSERVRCKVRVSLLPSFSGTGALEDSVCLGLSTMLNGGVTDQDTVGFDIPSGTFELGGNFAGLTYLPDGSGQEYTAPIEIAGFPDDAVITNNQDLNQVCITMEHSYLGDLEIWLECPTGQIVPLVNSYGPGQIPGGNSGGGTYLGHPIDDSGGGGPGIGWEYCFSSLYNTINGSMTQNLNNTVPVPFQPPLSAGNSIDPSDTYQPETAFNNFTGCPVNGTWTIHVQDNLGIDDGYIFEWGLYFDASFFPGLGSYQTQADTSWWTYSPTIISGQNDTSIVVQPSQVGTAYYTFNIIDNYGCAYDTTVSLVVLPLATIFDDTIACNKTFQVFGTSAYAGGVWSSLDTAITFSNSLINNPIISTSTPGIYEVLFTDNQCNYTDTATIEFPPYIYVQVLDTVICTNANFELNPLTVNTGPLQSGYNPPFYLIWENGSTDSIRIINQPGNYIATISNDCYTYSDTATIGNYVCEITAPNIVVLSSQAGNNTFYVNYSGLENFNCVITNRWGNTIYEYSDPAGYWDGKTQEGTLVDEGVYFYRIKATLLGGEDIKLHGFVHLKY